jgi:hypothetical protein
MQIPDEFYDFCLYLHQDSFEVYGRSIEEIVDGAMRHMPRDRRARLGDYVTHLLAGGYSDQELQDIYRSTDAEIGIRTGIRQFLITVRDATGRSGGP